MSRDSSCSDCSSCPFSRATAAWLATVSSRRRSSSSKRLPSPRRLMIVTAPNDPALADERADHRLPDRARDASVHAGGHASRGTPRARDACATAGHRRRGRPGASSSRARRRRRRSSGGPRHRPGREEHELHPLRPEHLARVLEERRRSPNRAPARSGGAGSIRRAARGARASRARRCRPDRRGRRWPSAPPAGAPTAGPPTGP